MLVCVSVSVEVMRVSLVVVRVPIEAMIVLKNSPGSIKAVRFFLQMLRLI
jgi:hypothetical protein